LLAKTNKQNKNSKIVSFYIFPSFTQVSPNNNIIISDHVSMEDSDDSDGEPGVPADIPSPPTFCPMTELHRMIKETFNLKDKREDAMKLKEDDHVWILKKYDDGWQEVEAVDTKETGVVPTTFTEKVVENVSLIQPETETEGK
jgi:hypothetical protein